MTKRKSKTNHAAKTGKCKSLRGTEEDSKPKKGKSNIKLIVGAIAAAGIGFLLFSSFRKDTTTTTTTTTTNSDPLKKVDVSETIKQTFAYNPSKLGKTNKATTAKAGKSENVVPTDTDVMVTGYDGVNKYYSTNKGFIPVADITITGAQSNNLTD